MSDCSSNTDAAEDITSNEASQSQKSSIESLIEIEKANIMKRARRLRFKNCAICGIIKNQVSFHRFPTAPDMRAIWADFCDLDVNKLGTHPVICGNHFNEDDFLENQPFHGCKKWLKRNSIPSRNPPKSRRSEEHLSEELNYETIVVGNFSDSSLYVKEEPSSVYEDNHDFGEDDVSGQFDDSRFVDSDDEIESKLVEISNGNLTLPPLTCKRKFPRYFMDIKSQDVSSPKYAKLCLEMGRETIFNYRKRINTLQHQNKKLENKLLCAEEIFRQLKNNSISVTEALNVVKTRHIFKFSNKACFI